jgi:hypothetical protein
VCVCVSGTSIGHSTCDTETGVLVQKYIALRGLIFIHVIIEMHININFCFLIFSLSPITFHCIPKFKFVFFF